MYVLRERKIERVSEKKEREIEGERKREKEILNFINELM